MRSRGRLVNRTSIPRPSLCASVLALACSSSCGEPRIDVSFVVPELYRPLTTAVRFSLFVVPPQRPFDCDALAHGEVDESTSALAWQSGTLLAAPSTHSIGNIARDMPKVLLAEALDEQGERIAVGCQAAGSIEEATHVSLRAEPVTRLVLEAGDPQEGFELPARLVVSVVDALARPLEGTALRWRLHAGAGYVRAGDATTDAFGRAAINVDPDPEIPLGPFAVQVSSRWSRVPPVVRSGFYARGFRALGEEITLAGRIAAVRFGFPGPAGEPGFAAITATEPRQAPRLLVGHLAGSGVDARLLTAEMELRADGGPPAIGLVRRPTGPGDLVLAATNRQCIYSGDGGRLMSLPFTPAAPLPEEPGLLGPVTRCDADASAEIVIPTADATRLAAYRFSVERCLERIVPDALGEASAALVGSQDYQLRHVGCIADDAGLGVRALQLTSVSEPFRHKLLVAQRDRWRLTRDWTLTTNAISFAPPLPNDPPALIGAGEAIEGGAQLELYRLAGIEAPYAAISGLHAVAGTVGMTAGGDLDGDGWLDVLYLLQANAKLDTRYRVGVVLRALSASAAINALWPGELGTRPWLGLLDLDRDGRDEIVLLEASTDRRHRLVVMER